MKRLGLVAVLALLVPAACKGSSSESSSADTKNQATAQAEAPSTAATTKDEPKADPNLPGPDIYPGFNFGVLTAEERGKFVNVAKAELCPCPNAAVSMHECLQKEDLRCSMAEQAATVVAMGIKQGLNQGDVLGQLAEFIESSKKKYDFDLRGTPFKGSADAPIVFVEFADFQCPHCREAGKVFSKIEKKYGNKVAVYYKHFPLSGHPEARYAAQAAVAAHQQGRFWPMHDLIFDNQMTLSKEKIDGFARQIGLNFEKFQKDVNSPDIMALVEADRVEGEKANLTGTPTIFLNGVRYMGERTEEAIAAAIDTALESTDTKK